ncbi:MAG: phosphoglucosamine mutase [Promethearchaeota archaeon]
MKLISFGTSGIRRVFQNYSESDLMFTPQMALEVGLALGSYLNGGLVVIGKDIRTSALPIEYALISGLVSTGCIVKTLGIVTTPTLAMSLKVLKADAGVMITASHNTPEYIGLKLWNPSGLGFSPDQEMEIARIYNEKNFLNINWDEVGKVTPINDINDIHISNIRNGAGCEIVTNLLTKYGCKLVSLNAQMDGRFPGRLSEPSEENLRQISAFIKISTQGNIGIALDGDADRVIFLDEDGEIVDPIRLLALLAKQYLSNKNNLSKNNMKIVTPINSSNLLEDVLTPLGCEVIRTEVGDIKVAIALKEHGGFLGGETSGTYIWPEFHYGPDSIVTIAKLLQIIVTTGKTLKQLMKEIPKYPYYQTKFRLKKDIPFSEEINQKIIETITDLLEGLGKKIENINQMDGCRFDYNDGWILIRRSGTSPYLRISGESSKTMEETQELNKLVAEKMKELKLIL